MHDTPSGIALRTKSSLQYGNNMDSNINSPDPLFFQIHPLSECPMGSIPNDRVVNRTDQVFKGNNSCLYDG